MATFTEATVVSGASYCWSDSDDNVWRTSSSGLYKSTNRGLDWSLINGSAPPGRIFVAASGAIFILRSGYGVYVSTDDGDNFTLLMSCHASAQYAIQCITEDSEGHVFWGEYGLDSSYNSQRIYRTDPPYTSYSLVLLGEWGGTFTNRHVHAVAADPLNDDIYCALGDTLGTNGYTRVMYSSDHGATWNTLWTYQPQITAIAFSDSYVFYGEDKDSVEGYSRIYRAQRRSATVTTVYTPAGDYDYCDFFSAVSRQDGDNWMVAFGSVSVVSGYGLTGRAEVIATMNEGASWTILKQSDLGAWWFQGFTTFSNIDSQAYWYVTDTIANLTVRLQYYEQPVTWGAEIEVALASIASAFKELENIGTWGMDIDLPCGFEYQILQGDDVDFQFVPTQPAAWNEVSFLFGCGLWVNPMVLISDWFHEPFGNLFDCAVGPKDVSEVLTWPFLYLVPNGDQVDFYIREYMPVAWNEVNWVWPLHLLNDLSAGPDFGPVLADIVLRTDQTLIMPAIFECGMSLQGILVCLFLGMGVLRPYEAGSKFVAGIRFSGENKLAVFDAGSKLVLEGG